MSVLAVNNSRFWNRLMEMARVGGTEKGGVCRLALTEEDRIGRELFIKWCEQAGCTVTVDELGNIFARREGRDPELPAVLIGSHLDSQPTGGKYDGALGVLAGLEVLETLNDYDVETECAVEVVSWTNEEGARFTPAMLASGGYAGVFSKDFVENRRDENGVRFIDALEAIGFKGKRKLGSGTYKASLELHIEQGPVLEAEEVPVGIVTGVQGIRWYDLQVNGSEAHAGPTPMSYRKDPVKDLLPVLSEIYAMADAFSPHARVTIGSLKSVPGVRNTVPGELKVTVDLRHPETDVLNTMHDRIQQIVQKHNAAARSSFVLSEVWYSPPVYFDKACIDALQNAVEANGAKAMKMVSGAGHDSVYLSKVMPAAMIFIPCKDGLSHNELEHIEREHAVAGANVLLNAALELAQQPHKTLAE